MLFKNNIQEAARTGNFQIRMELELLAWKLGNCSQHLREERRRNAKLAPRFIFDVNSRMGNVIGGQCTQDGVWHATADRP
jgi:hypothetical protein